MKYFRDDEFKCRCQECGMDVDEAFKLKLDEARGVAQTPFRINSGARCPKHNAKVGGSPNSSHLKGLAVDIAYTSDLELAKIIRGLTWVGIGRIGVNEKKKFIHCDVDTNKPNAVWSY